MVAEVRGSLFELTPGDDKLSKFVSDAEKLLFAEDLDSESES